MKETKHLFQIHVVVTWCLVLATAAWVGVIAQTENEDLPARGRVGSLPFVRRRYQGNPGDIEGEYVVSAVLPLRKRTRVKRSSNITTDAAGPTPSKILLNDTTPAKNGSYLEDVFHIGGLATKDAADIGGVRKASNDRASVLRRLVWETFLHNVGSLEHSANPEASGNSSKDGMMVAEQRQLRGMFQPFRRAYPSRIQIQRPMLGFHGGNVLTYHNIEQEHIPTFSADNHVPVLTEPFLNELATAELARRPDISNPAVLSIMEEPALLEPAFLAPAPNNFKKNKEIFRRIIPRPSASRRPPTNMVVKPKEPRCDRFTEDICLEDSDYPSSAIMNTIFSERHKFNLLYAELKQRENQVDGLTRKQEQSYTHGHYFGTTRQDSGPNRPRNYGPQGGFVCPSEIYYAKPQRARNKQGDWKVVINVADYTQTLRMEKCTVSGTPCNYIQASLQSTCSQVFSYHRLLVFDKERGLHMDVFKIPTACSCHIRGSKVIFPPTRAAEEPPTQETPEESTNNDSKASFSNTLWAILSGGGDQSKEEGPLSPHLMEQVRKQVALMQELHQYPQFLRQVSPSQVLSELLKKDEDPEPRTHVQYQQPTYRPDPQTTVTARHQLTTPTTGSSYRNQRRPLTKRPLFGMPRPVSETGTISLRPVGRIPQIRIPEVVYPAGFSESLEDSSGFKPILVQQQHPVSERPNDGAVDDLLAEERKSVSHSVSHNSTSLPAPPASSSPTRRVATKGGEHEISESASKINFSYHPILEYISRPK